MRVLFLIHRPQARGQEIFACQLGQELIKRGIEVKLLALFSGKFQLPFFAQVSSLELKSSLHLWNPKSWKAFSRVVADFQPDLIQANGGDTLKFLALSSFLLPAHIKKVFNNGGVMSFYLKSSLQHGLNSFFLQKMDALISVSEYSKSDLESTFQPRLPHQVIPIAVQIPNLQIQASQELTWIHIGGFTQEKNHTGLLEIFQQFISEKRGSKLHLIGDGKLRKELERQVELRKIRSNVFFRGSMKNPWNQVPFPYVVLLPSLIEGMPGVIAEALCLGVPVIAYRVGGIAELERKFSSLIAIPPDNQDLFLQAMKEVQNNFDHFLDLAESEKEKARLFFGIERAALDFLDFYSELCG